MQLRVIGRTSLMMPLMTFYATFGAITSLFGSGLTSNGAYMMMAEHFTLNEMLQRIYVMIHLLSIQQKY